MKKITKEKLIIVTVILLSLFRIGLTLKLPLAIYTDQLYDDALLFKYAESILAGNWLGEYNNLTLVKGISYPIFIVLGQLLFMPYTLLLSVFNIGSAYLFVKAIEKVFKRKIFLPIIYIILIYSPVGFSFLISQRLYRMAIIPYSVLAVFACTIGFYLRRNEELKNKLPWAIGSGIFLLFFWNIREDSIWIAPFIIVVTLLVVIEYLFLSKYKGIKLIKNTLVAIIPTGILMFGILCISMVNFHYYGLFTTNDRSATYFADMMSLLYKMDAEDENKEVWISRDAIEKALDASKTFNSIRPSLESSMGAWSQEGPIKGDLIAWTIRDAVQSAGYYKDPKETNKFYKKVVEELEAAYESGELVKKDAIYFSSQSTGIKLGDIPELIIKSISKLWDMSSYTECNVSNSAYGTGDAGKIRDIEALTGSFGNYYNQSSAYFNGWIFAIDNDDNLRAEIVDNEGNVISNVKFVESKDVLNVYKDSDNAEKCRFEIKIDNVGEGPIYMNLYLNDKFYKKIDIGNYADENILGAIDFQMETQVDSIPKYSERAANIGNAVDKIYQKLSLAVNGISIIAYICLTLVAVNKIFKKKWIRCEAWIIITGVLLSAFVLVFGVITFTQWFDEGMQQYIQFYATGTYPLIQIVKYLSIALMIERLLDYRVKFRSVSK